MSGVARDLLQLVPAKSLLLLKVAVEWGASAAAGVQHGELDGDEKNVDHVQAKDLHTSRRLGFALDCRLDDDFDRRGWDG